MQKELLLKVVEGREPGQPVAFTENILCLFDKAGEQPQIGSTVSVMITGVMYADAKTNPGYKDHSRVKFLFVTPVTDKVYLVSHEGFECSGSMCQTLSQTVIGSTLVTLTPGRTEVFYADNVGKMFYKLPNEPKRPGFAYVKSSDVRQLLERRKVNGAVAGGVKMRIEGITSVAELNFKRYAQEAQNRESVSN